MHALAVLFERPEQLSLAELALDAPGPADAVVETLWSGISTGTERLLWTGRMPPFPGMGYPLVPGYESVGEVVEAGPASGLAVGQRVFVPGTRCFGPVRGLFGGAASRLVSDGARLVPIDADLREHGILIALAATAYHALHARPEGRSLIVGHGVLGRLLARLTRIAGGEPVVWETNAIRATGAQGYEVVHPDADETRDYGSITDVSGDAAILDTLIGRLRPGGEIVLAGFYEAPLSFAFPPAFLREARIRVAAQWRPDDLAAVLTLIEGGRLSLDGLITHRETAAHAPSAYRTAFGEPECLKMILDWRAAS